MAAGLVMTGLGPNVIIVSNWFKKHRGKVVGMVVASSSLGGATLPLLISPIVNNPEWGWRWGFGLLSILFWIFAVIPVYKVIRSTPEVMGLHPDGNQEALADGTEIGKAQPIEDKDRTQFRDALFSRALFCLGIGSACLWFAIQGLNSQIRIFFELDIGFTAQQSVILFSIIYWFSFIGKFSFGALSDRVPKRTVLFISSCVLFIGSLLLFEISENELILTKNTMQLSFFTVFFGLGFGGSFSMIQLVAVETFGKKYLGRVLGIISMIDGLAAAGATQLLASMADNASGSYLQAFGLVAIVTLIGIINVFFIKPMEIKPKSI
jgi:sugar phosphate permease